MTRDEAIDKVEAVYYALRKHPLGPGAQAVDVLVVLGLLKLDEPKSAEDEARKHMHALGWTDQFIWHLRDGGFKIVKA